MRKIQFKLAKKHEKQIELKETKLDDIKSRNEAANKRNKTVSNIQDHKEYETMRNFVAKEKKRVKQIERRNQNLQNDSWTDDPYIQLKEELEKRRSKYTILTKKEHLASEIEPYFQDTKLLKKIDFRLRNASNRRNQNVVKLEWQFELRRENERLKQEEINELKALQKRQQE